jgi:hypothetical protein
MYGMALREKMKQVAWKQLTHAYGSAEDTPEHLLALLSSDAQKREKALYDLWASLCHQGSVYEASCAAVPFLIEILSQVPDEQQPSILYLLAGLAHRDSYAQRDQRTLRIDHSTGNHCHEWWSAEQFLQTGNAYHDPQWMGSVHRLVGEGVPVYLEQLQAGDDETVIAINYLLSAFPELGESLIPAVNALFVTSTDPFLQASFLFCLSTLLDGSSSLWHRHRLLIDAENTLVHPVVRFTAAYTLARYHTEEVSPTTVEPLANALLFPERLDELIQMLPFYDAPIQCEACEALCHVGVPVGLFALIKALKQGAARWRVLDTVRIAEALLDVAFFGGWVHDRYWSHTATRPLTANRMIARLVQGDTDPYEERSYYNYGQHSDSRSTDFTITCLGYDESETRKLQSVYDHEGHEALTDTQRQAIEAVLHCDPLWHIESDLLKIYGLPATREALVQFLRAH